MVLAWSLMFGAFASLGYERTLGLWGVPVLAPRFIDFRLIPGTSETLNEGLDPTLENPGDPGGRLFNYPPAWNLVLHAGITQDDTGPIVVAGIVLLFAAFCVFPGAMHLADVPLILGVTFSPAAMLLYDRGNVDIFFIALCVGILVATRRAAIASLLVLGGAVFKFYPVFAAAVFAKESPRRALAATGAIAAGLATYVVWFQGSITRAWMLTQRGQDISYGAAVLPLHFETALTRTLARLAAPDLASAIVKWGPYLAAVAVLAGCALYCRRARSEAPIDDQRNLDAFRIGAAIYVGTFLLGNNWDYRLTFLVFTIPQCASWTRARGGRHWRLPAVTLALCFCSCWYLFFRAVLSRAHLASSAADMLFVVDELVNWSLFAALVCLLLMSVPACWRCATPTPKES